MHIPVWAWAGAMAKYKLKSLPSTQLQMSLPGLMLPTIIYS